MTIVTSLITSGKPCKVHSIIVYMLLIVAIKIVHVCVQLLIVSSDNPLQCNSVGDGITGSSSG